VFESVRGIALSVGDTAMNQAFYAATAAGQHREDPDGFCRRFWGFYLSPMAVADSLSVRRLAPIVCRDRPDSVQGLLDANATRLAPLIRTDLRPQLRALPMPVLLVQGDAQPTYTFLAREWKAAVPSLHLRFVPGWPQFAWVHQPTEVARVVQAFLAGQPIPGAE
jgi:pimeloyl-ACP methyl ester carboxylesterase